MIRVGDRDRLPCLFESNHNDRYRLCRLKDDNAVGERDCHITIGGFG